MLNRLYQFGCVDSDFDVPADKLALELSAFRQDADILALKGGRVVKLGADGVELAASGDEQFAGFLVNDVAGNDYENVPAYASGKAPVMLGGGLVETDQVIEDDIASGELLYIGADGQLTNTDPGSATPFGLARSSNSATDKTLKVQF